MEIFCWRAFGSIRHIPTSYVKVEFWCAHLGDFKMRIVSKSVGAYPARTQGRAGQFTFAQQFEKTSRRGLASNLHDGHTMIETKQPCGLIRFFALLLMVMGFFAAPREARAQNIKLYLKDGSYELVRSYEVHGERVRFYSLDRSDWEEIPAALVDFDATRRAQQEEKIADKKELEKARELDKERIEIPSNTGFEVAPGIHLP